MIRGRMSEAEEGKERLKEVGEGFGGTINLTTTIPQD